MSADVEDLLHMRDLRIADLEAQIEGLEVTIAAYRRREETVSRVPQCPKCCKSVSQQGTPCELDPGHGGPHVRHEGSLVRRWGG